MINSVILGKTRYRISFQQVQKLKKVFKIILKLFAVLTEGRGSAQGEIGLAAIDLKRPVLILCQISDTQTYMNTINKINILNPAEVPIYFLKVIIS